MPLQEIIHNTDNEGKTSEPTDNVFVFKDKRYALN